MSTSSRLRAGTAALLTTLVATFALAGCGAGESSREEKLTVYVSSPTEGPLRSTGEDIANGARLALEDAGGEAAGVPVEAIYLSESEAGAPNGWSATAAAANARRAVQDSTSIAYIGDFASGATRYSLPITNEADLLQVSPGASADDLTGSDDSGDVPGELEPTGTRTFARVVPSDSVQAAATVAWAQRLELRALNVIGGRSSPYAERQTAALQRAGAQAGFDVTVDADGGLPGGAAEYIPFDGPTDPILRPGMPTIAASPAGAFTSAAVVGGDAPLPEISPDAPLRITSAAMFPGNLPPAGLDFTLAYGKRFDRKPGSYAAYGYEAMAAVLDSIERAEDPLSRDDVIDAFFAISERDSILGTYTIDSDGDTSLDRVGAYEKGRGPLTSLDAIEP